MYNDKEHYPMKKFNEYVKHKGHLERLYLSKSLINNKCPKIPSIFKKDIKNRNKGNENKLQINKDNQNFYKKLVHIVNANSKYNSIKNIPSKCPAFERKDKIQIKRYKSIINENYLFYKILTKTKSTLDIVKNEKDYLNSRYYKYNICKNKSSSNPNIIFATYNQFNKNIKNAFKNKLLFNKTINYNDNSISMIKKNKRKINNMSRVYKVNASV